MASEPAERAGVPSLGKLLGDAGAAVGTILGRVAGIDFDHSMAGTFSLAAEDFHEEAPPHVGNRLGQGMVLEHPLDVQLLNEDGIEAGEESMAHLVGVIQAGALNPQMRFRQQGARFAAALAAFHPAGEASLGELQLPLGTFQPLGVRDAFPVVQGGERFDAEGDPDTLPRLGPGARLVVADDTGIPAIGTVAKGASLGLARERAVGAEPDAPDLGEGQPTVFDPGAPTFAELRISEAVIPAPPSEAGVARLFARLAAAEECLKGAVNPVEHVLKHLGMDTRQIRVLRLQAGKRGGLLGEVDRPLLRLPRFLSFTQGVVVEMAAGLQRLVQFCFLRSRGAQLVDERFLQHQSRFDWASMYRRMVSWDTFPAVEAK